MKKIKNMKKNEIIFKKTNEKVIENYLKKKKKERKEKPICIFFFCITFCYFNFF